MDPSAAIVFSGREEMLSGVNAFFSLALLWRMPGGAQHGQKDDLIRLMLICRKISETFQIAGQTTMPCNLAGTTDSQASKFPPVVVS